MASVSCYRDKGHEESSNDDSSDDESCDVWKRRKPTTYQETKNSSDNEMPVVVTAPSVVSGPNNAVQKKKVNNIWSSVLEEQAVSDVLGHCGLEKQPIRLHDRNVENYDFRRKMLDTRYDDLEMESENFSCEDNISDYEEEFSSASKPQKNCVSPNAAKPSTQRFKPWIKNFVKLSKADAEVAAKIVRVLNEKKKYLIYRTVHAIGVEKALELLEKTESIEEQGGMLIKNNARRRTPGGVYIQLLKNDESISKDKIDKIFEGEDQFWNVRSKVGLKKKRKKYNMKRKQKKKSTNGESMDISMDDECPAEGSSEKPNDSILTQINDPSNICDSTKIESTVQEPVHCKDEDSEIEEGEIQD